MRKRQKIKSKARNKRQRTKDKKQRDKRQKGKGTKDKRIKNKRRPYIQKMKKVRYKRLSLKSSEKTYRRNAKEKTKEKIQKQYTIRKSLLGGGRL